MVRNKESKAARAARPATTSNPNKFDQGQNQLKQNSFKDRSGEWDDPKSAPPGDDNYVYSEDEDDAEFERSALNSRLQSDDNDDNENGLSRQHSSLSNQEKENFRGPKGLDSFRYSFILYKGFW